MADSSGDIFGTTAYGGEFNGGTLFEWVKSTGTLVTLANFSDSSGFNCGSNLIEGSSGNNYGALVNGGANDDGAIFEWVKSTGNLVTLVSFDGSNGARPFGNVVMDAGGNLHGTTESSGVYSTGTLWEYVQSNGTINDLFSFGNPDDNIDGSQPACGVIADSSGNLYGTTSDNYGGENGTIFEWVQSTSTLETLANFNGTNGSSPAGNLIMDQSGNLYGTAYQGGLYGYGAVFEWVKSTGSISDFISFNGTEGTYPSDLIEGNDGTLIGTTYGNGINEE
jgi:hypothetical protein